MGSHSDCEPGIYSREGNRWEEYKQKVEDARREPPSCKVEGECSTCYGEVIARDLKAWEGASVRRLCRLLARWQGAPSTK